MQIHPKARHRDSDGYVNMTELCRQYGKEFKSWKRSNKPFIEAAAKGGYPVQTVRAGAKADRGTWAHPIIAVEVLKWMDLDFYHETIDRSIEAYFKDPEAHHRLFEAMFIKHIKSSCDELH